ncbi:ABC transporter permease [Labrys wisconsinensis]|uniref:Simple sugar transport system permease protein/ribose transport system permease protein n=1 Tax=Labrys wisconsinensis TaxID=425677 RepID=A0ABU0J125_9HYPH|nr:ABC transporter permease [Labrys wisconsinensis]MDQ0467325.1 simple sugar transport system permease protein/ribose transport system permease protein [Labrys wisconsinensis]
MLALTQSTSPPGRSARIVPLALIAAAIVLLVLAARWTTPAFATVDNAFVIVRAASITGIVAIGMSFVTISGNLFALSASQLAALLAVIFALATQALGFAGGAAATLAIAAAAGIAQGLAITVIGNPIVTTLAFGAVFRGLASLVSGNGIVRIDSAAASWFGTARPLGIPTQSWAFAAIALCGWFLIRRARIGRLLVLSGANRAAAIASGLSVGAATVAAMTLLCLGSAIVAIFTVAQFAQAKADLFTGTDFDYIAAVLVGGIALRGGQGSPLQAAFGAVLIALLQNFMLLNGLSAGVRMTIVGGLVVVATCAFHLLQGRAR